MYMGAEDRPVEGCIEGERVREGGPHTVAYRRLFTLLTYKGNHDTRGGERRSLRDPKASHS